MKKKIITIVLFALAFITVNAQIEKPSKVKIPKDKGFQKIEVKQKVNKNLKGKIEATNLYLFEPEFYKDYLRNRLNYIKGKRKQLYKNKQQNEKKIISLKLEEQDTEEQYTNTNDCNDKVDDDYCDKVKNASKYLTAFIIKPRDCPEPENCFPVVKNNLKYILVDKSVKVFKAEFFNTSGKKIGTTSGKPVSVKGFSDFNVYRVKLNSFTGRMIMRVSKKAFNSNKIVRYSVGGE